jgi:NitT/TauT family transport system ATP-binding protein
LCQRVGATALLVTHSVPEAVWLSDRILVMSRSPGQVAHVLNPGLPRPRSPALRESDAFFHMVVDIQRRLRGR